MSRSAQVAEEAATEIEAEEVAAVHEAAEVAAATEAAEVAAVHEAAEVAAVIEVAEAAAVHEAAEVAADRQPTGVRRGHRVCIEALPGQGMPRTGTKPGAPAVGAGVSAAVRRATELLAELVATLDPARLSGPDAAVLYGLFVGVERLTMAGKTLLAPRIDESGVWRDGGHRSPAVMLAELEGVPTGQARSTLEVGHRLPDLPGTEQALRSGTLSGPKVVELTGAAVLDPANEGCLLDGAGDAPLQKVRERCHRARATAERQDPVATVRRIHGARHFSSWTDPEGAFCFQGRDTADRGAKVLQQLQHTVSRLRAVGRTEGAVAGGTDARAGAEADRALRADAFFLLMTDRTAVAGPRSHASGDVDPGPPDEQISVGHPTGSIGPAPSQASSRAVGDTSDRPGDDGLVGRPPSCSLMVRVDLDALLRGDVGPDEVCEIDNQGPIPVAMARDLANDSFLRLAFHRAGDIRAVSHLGRTINRRLRTALAHRDRCCVVPGCGVPYGLEIDHIVPFAKGGPTELSNLALLCHHHHYLKTYEGWTLESTGPTGDGSLNWAFSPMPPFGAEPDPDSG